MLYLKKNNYLKFLTIFLFALALILLASCGNQQQEKKFEKLELSSPINKSELVLDDTLVVAVSPYYPPYEYDDDGVIKGFEIDLAEMISKSLDLEFEVIPYVKNDYLFDDSVQGNKFDITMATIVKNEENAKVINFSEPYISAKPKMLFVTKKDSNISENNLEQAIANKTKISISTVSSYLDTFKEQFPNADIVLTNTYEEQVKLLNSGECGIVLTDDGFWDYVKDKDDYKVAKTIEISEDYVIAISKNKPNLLKTINEVIEKRSADGTIDQLKKKYNLD